MHISHIAIWSTHLEELKNFYITYFNGTSHEKYINPKRDLNLILSVLTKDSLPWKLCNDKTLLPRH